MGGRAADDARRPAPVFAARHPDGATIRAVFRLAYRQAEQSLGFVVGLLGLELRVPDHTTLSRCAAMLDVPRPGNAGADAGGEPLHLLVDSTGLL